STPGRRSSAGVRRVVSAGRSTSILWTCEAHAPTVARVQLGIIRAPRQTLVLTSAPPIDPRQLLAQLVAQTGGAEIPDQRGAAIVLERPRQAGHGDYASNLALQLAKPLKRNPREIAQALVRALPTSPWLAKAEVAGAGFINLFLTAAAKQRVVREILAQGEDYGRSSFGRGKKVQAELVSAN